MSTITVDNKKYTIDEIKNHYEDETVDTYDTPIVLSLIDYIQELELCLVNEIRAIRTTDICHEAESTQKLCKSHDLKVC